jgi:hypothetical protein
VDVPVRGEEVVHDNKVDLAAAWELYSVKAVESRKQRVRVVFHVVVVVFENREQELVFRVVDGFNDEAIVSGKVKEGAGFAGRS